MKGRRVQLSSSFFPQPLSSWFPDRHPPGFPRVCALFTRAHATTVMMGGCRRVAPRRAAKSGEARFRGARVPEGWSCYSDSVLVRRFVPDKTGAHAHVSKCHEIVGAGFDTNCSKYELGEGNTIGSRAGIRNRALFQLASLSFHPGTLFQTIGVNLGAALLLILSTSFSVGLPSCRCGS